MKMIRTLIVDDEPLARQTIHLLLQGDPEIKIIAECGDGAQAVKLIFETKPDLVFLDIQMPEMDGFEVLAKIRPERAPVVIFVTAFDSYAIQAFDAQALDYLLKPFVDARFRKAVKRAKEMVRQQEFNDLSRSLVALIEDHKSRKESPGRHGGESERGHVNRFMIKAGGRIAFVKTDEVDWIEADEYYVRLHVGSKSHMLRETMNDLETQLDPRKFVRIHRSAIVNIDRVKEMHHRSKGDYSVILHNGTQLRLTRSRRQQIQSLLSEL